MGTKGSHQVPLEPALLQAESVLVHQPPPFTGQVLQPQPRWWSSPKLAAVCVCLSHTGGPKRNTVSQYGLTRAEQTRSLLHQLAGYVPVHTAQGTAGQTTLLAYTQLAVHPDPQDLVIRADPQPSSPQPASLQKLVQSQVRTFRLLLLNFMRFLSAHSSSLLRSL